MAQVGRVPLLLLDSDVEDNARADPRASPTGSTAATASTGCARSCCSASAACGRCAPTRRITGAPGAGGLPHQRGPRRLPRPGADPRARPRTQRRSTSTTALEVGPRRHGVHHAHAGAGRHRPLPARPDRAVLRRRQRLPRRPGRADPRARRRGLRRRRPDGVQHGRDGLPARAARQRRLAAARRTSAAACSTACGRASTSAEVPITSITNGVHAPTWVAREVFDLAAAPSGADLGRRRAAAWDGVDKIPGARSGRPSARCARSSSTTPARRLRGVLDEARRAAAELGWIDDVLDPDVLTIGFARRVPTYKRLTLMLRDPERLKRLLLHPERPVQLVIAGKSHPADDGGKKLIQEIVRFADDPEVRHRIVFLPNYDIAMAQPLYPGCDVWLNNPLRPLRGLRHVRHEGRAQRRPQPLDPRRLVGRVVRRRQRLGDPVGRRRRRPRPPRRHRGGRALRPDRERGRAAVLRPRRRRAAGPAGSRWSGTRCKSLGPKVLATRMVRDYVAQLYAPAAAAGRARSNGPTTPAPRELAAWKAAGARGLAARPGRPRRVQRRRRRARRSAPTLEVRAFVVARASSTPDDVECRSCTAGRRRRRAGRHRHGRRCALAETYEAGRHRFEGAVALDRTGAFGYTVRVLPRTALLASPAELGLVALPGLTARASRGRRRRPRRAAVRIRRWARLRGPAARDTREAGAAQHERRSAGRRGVRRRPAAAARRRVGASTTCRRRPRRCRAARPRPRSGRR